MERKLKSSELKLMARRALAGKYGISVGMQVVVGLLTLLGGIVTCVPLFMVIIGAELRTGAEAMVFGGLAAFFVLLALLCALSVVLTAGVLRFFYHICTGQAFGMGDLLYGFKNKWWRFVGLGFLLTVIGLIIGVPQSIVQAARTINPWATWLYGLELFLTLFTFVVSVVISLFFGQAVYILVEDRDKKVFSSLAESVRLMRGNKGRYFYLSLSFIGIYLLSFCTLGLGYLWAMPYMYCTYTYFYLDIKKRYQADTGAVCR